MSPVGIIIVEDVPRVEDVPLAIIMIIIIIIISSSSSSSSIMIVEDVPRRHADEALRRPRRQGARAII